MPDAHLRTKYVFIDTQSFRRARCDWNGRAFTKLSEFAKHGHLNILVTDVTLREVKSQLNELLSETQSSLTKHAGVLAPLGITFGVNPLTDRTSAQAALEAALDEFLKRMKARHVPIEIDVKALIDDYFTQRAPFSAKKKFEFPDAISIASIRAWCVKHRYTAYIVSEDADLEACCSDAGPLFHARTLEEIITQATVSKTFHDALETALRESDYLSRELADWVKGVDVKISRRSSDDTYIHGASLEEVYSVNITSLNVLDQTGHTFTCEPEVEAEVELSVEVEVAGRDYGPEDYEPTHYYRTSVTKTEYFYPEVIVTFDLDTSLLEVESIDLGGSVEIGPEDLRRHW